MKCPQCGVRGSLRNGEIRRFNTSRQVGRHQLKEHGAVGKVTLDNVRQHMKIVRSKEYRASQKEVSLGKQLPARSLSVVDKRRKK